ncbi:hypothetical protein LOC68_02235 [Blastopirellula sp. JC732]|uniref:MoxR-vWA-beta-propeller ternary system domain-containing protein n=1 Tax=Blastopirellula sediminis TaxID=2894196 RepID=A0A9X1MI56_9BACT|nr:hypothetical protein [Blastopirellula sediminis]MCC9607991.1 hypothetical protein [Blastopirellula sediminis]MCC9627216.1 hypothetical protein [Blastopirellula sediminis]
MIERTVQLRYTPHPLRDATAWLIASPDPADWLQAIAACGAQTQIAVRLLMIPGERYSQTVGGAFLFLPENARGDLRPLQAAAKCVPYGKVGKRLFVPIEATFDPALSPEELQTILAADLTYVWHPAAGLIGFEADDVWQSADFLEAGLAVDRRWDRATAGTQLAPKLRSLAPSEPPGIEIVLQQGKGDIGSESEELGNRPPDADRPQPGLGHSIQWFGLKVLGAGLAGLSALGGALAAGAGSTAGGAAGGNRPGPQPSGSGGPSWLQRLESWMSERLAGLDQALLSEREKAIQKLMGLLDSDPDEGLKYALPLGGRAGRGIAPPGSRLSSNDVNFNMNRLGGGGGPGDAWNLDWETQQKLTARYRELANRELRLGRYRRAAYIFGELLNDISAAASALEQGEHWREAAVLYRERLKQPLAAARCYENGGLWTEACQLYEEIDEFEKAGDILTRLEQHEEAKAQYRKEVVKRRSRGELLAAARLLELKLDAVDEAVEELESAWPATSQAGPCLQEMIALLGRHARHDAAGTRLRKLRDETVPHPIRIKQIEIIAEASASYPDRRVQAQAADDTRVLASRMLKGGSVIDSSRVLDAVRKVAPEDRLLARDCTRFDEARNARAPLPTLKSSRLQRTAELIHQFQIPWKALRWKSAVSSANMIFAAGVFHGHLKLFRYGFDGNLAPQQFSPNRQSQFSDPEILLAVNGNHPDFVVIHPFGGPPIADAFEFPETNRIAYRTRAGSLPGMTGNLCGAAHSGQDLVWLLEFRNQSPTLIGVRTGGEIAVTETLDIDFHTVALPLNESRFVPMFANGRMVYIGAGERLCAYRQGVLQHKLELDQPIYQLAGTLPNTRSRVAVAMERGGVVFWDDAPDGKRERFSTQMSHPQIVFNRGGLLISASGRTGEVYSTHDTKLKLEAELEFSGNVVAVASDISPNRFSVLLESGEIQQFLVSG